MADWQPDEVDWDELERRARSVLGPLLDGGWTVTWIEHEQSEDDCVTGALGRDGRTILWDHYPDGWSLLWNGHDGESDGEPTPPDLSIEPDTSAVFARRMYVEVGWL